MKPHIMDLTLIALVSTISIVCIGVFLLPLEIQNMLKVRHAIFNPVTYITASFVHDNFASLGFNLLVFAAFAFLLYFINKKAKKGKIFLYSLPTIFVVLPLLNYSLLFYVGIYKAVEFGYGLSLVDSALIGFALPSITIFFRGRVKRFNAILFFLSIVLFTLLLVFLPYSSSNLLLLGFCAIFGFMIGGMEFRKIWRLLAESFRQKQRRRLVESYIVMCTLFFYFFSILGLFPSNIMMQEGITDIVSHFIGIIFGISLLYPLCRVFERVHVALVRRIRKYASVSSIYVVLLVAFTLSLFLYLFFSPFSLSSGNAESIRSLLNSNAQSLSAVIAIVISFSLIAVQLVSQAYSPRIIRIYVRDYLFWLIIGQFMLAILFNLSLLNWYQESYFDPKLADISIFITGVCLLSLIPHVYRTFEQLNPENIVLSLCKDVDEDYVDLLKKHWRGGFVGSTLPEETNPLFIIRGLLKKSDRATVTAGLRYLSRRFLELVNKKNSEMLSYHFATFFWRLGNNAISNYDEEKAYLSCLFMSRIIEKMFEKGIETRSFDEALRELGKRALDSRLRETCSFVISHIKKIAEKEMKKTLPKEEEVLEYNLIKGISIEKADTQSKTEATVTIWHFKWDRLGYLKEIGVEAAKLGIEKLIVDSLRALQEIGSKLLGLKMGDVMRRDLYRNLMTNVEEICSEAHEKHFKQHLTHLGTFWITASREKEKGRKDIVSIIVYYFSRIHLDAVQNGICDYGIINQLGTVGRTLIPDYEEEILFIVDVLGEIGKILREKEKGETLPLEIQEIRRNLLFVKEALESIKKWNNHKNAKIISKTESWIKKI